jgi:hypothetical protein
MFSFIKKFPSIRPAVCLLPLHQRLLTFAKICTNIVQSRVNMSMYCPEIFIFWDLRSLLAGGPPNPYLSDFGASSWPLWMLQLRECSYFIQNPQVQLGHNGVNQARAAKQLVRSLCECNN